MTLRGLASWRPTNHDWRILLVGISISVAYGYLGIKLNLVAGEYRLLTGALGGVFFGLYFRRFYEGIEYATVAAFASVVVLYVVFVVDDLIITSKYDVEVPVIHFQGGPLLDRLIAYNAYEVVVFLTTAPHIFLTALFGAWLGWVVRKIVTGLFPGRFGRSA